jgi:hypothetical protein
MRRIAICLAWIVAIALLPGAASGQQKFKELIGGVQVGPVKSTSPLEVPFITWGGDVPTFYANGGLTTTPNSIFGQQKLNLKLVPGDDFVGQVKRYLQGDTPFLRGTFSMMGLASEALGNDPRTKPVIFLQLTWSAGDHLVSREGLKKTNDLKGKKVCLQKNGPHVGMLDDILRVAGLKWSDVTVVWADDLTGEKGPAALFRADPSIDACFVISPDMLGLTGGLETPGTGAEGTVNGAHVLDSTAYLSRSIADVYACRKDFYDANRATVEKFAAGYLKACEEILPLKKEFDTNGSSAKYMDVLKLAQKIYGPAVLPTLEVDAHGLISDCTLVGLPGNVSFFTEKGNLNGFEEKQKLALNLAKEQGYADVRTGFFPPDFDFVQLAKLGKLTADVSAIRTPRFAGPEAGSEEDFLGDDGRTIVSFTINFQPNQDSFPPDVYGADFQRALEAASTYGNAVMSIRGHADPTKTLSDLIKAGMAKGLIQRTGQSGNYRYTMQGKPLNLEATADVVKLLERGAFDGTDPNPRETMQAALNLSLGRANAARDALIQYARAQGIKFDESQFQAVGAGVKEPKIARPKNLDQAKENMRVEFRVLRVPAEALQQGDFDF